MREALIKLIEHPPAWIGLILLVVLSAHTLKSALKLPPGSLIPILEFFVTVILGVILLHEIFGEPLFGAHENQGGLNILLALVLAFAAFTLLSGVLAIIDKKVRGP